LGALATDWKIILKRILKEENKRGLDSSGSEEGTVNMVMNHRISQIEENT
jgi:hypothetical protein